MATVRISGNWRNPSKMEWAGAPAVDEEGYIDRSIEVLPEEVYESMEKAIRRGEIEGMIQLTGGIRIQWVLDR